MTDEELIATWQRHASRQRWARERLPAPVRRIVSALYQQRPAARASRKGSASRTRVAEEVHRRCRGVVQRGPFERLVFPFATWDAPAKCIGSYERELHPEVERIIAADYNAIINVGCAEGFYAVGLARALPAARIHAYDTSLEAVTKCRQMAAANNVPTDQMEYGGEVTHAVLDRLCRPGSLLIADIEGGEADLLDPARAPGLKQSDLLVELHHHVVPDIEQMIHDRFEGTHAIRHVDSEPRDDASPYPELAGMSSEDQWYAMFERPITMRWLLLQVRETTHMRSA